MQRYEQQNTLDENGMQTGYSYTMQVDFVPLPCVGADCGAWHGGKCCYACVHLGDK